ncbi:unnamed protein product [Amoebophrya sp. A25]|nr:unnamed protein product [Amoebophrya sp. A25]|eukprot:GSA25T00018889001.1
MNYMSFHDFHQLLDSDSYVRPRGSIFFLLVRDRVPLTTTVVHTMYHDDRLSHKLQLLWISSSLSSISSPLRFIRNCIRSGFTPRRSRGTAGTDQVLELTPVMRVLPPPDYSGFDFLGAASGGGKQNLFPPLKREIPLAFFRTLFSILNRRFGDKHGEIPSTHFERAMTRVCRMIGDKERTIVAERYDVDGSGSVGWWEFVACWRDNRFYVSLSFWERISLTFEDPTSSRLARFLSLFLLLTILMSSVLFVIATLPVFRQWPDGNCESRCDVKNTGIILSAEETSYCESKCEPVPHGMFDLLELACVLVFTAEYSIRIVAAQGCRNELIHLVGLHQLVLNENMRQKRGPIYRMWVFFVDPLNMIDLLAVVPFYVEQLVGSGMQGSTVLRVIRLTRLFRLLKIARYFQTLKVIVLVVERAAAGLIVLLFVLMLCVVFSASVLYFAERGTWDPQTDTYIRFNWVADAMEETPFKSIPHSMWWAFVTYTTVGYGDIVPYSVVGQLLAILSMLCSMLSVGMPTSVLLRCFNDVWDENVQERLERERQTLVEREAVENVFLYSEPWKQCRRLAVDVYHETLSSTSHDFLGQVVLEFDTIGMPRQVGGSIKEMKNWTTSTSEAIHGSSRSAALDDDHLLNTSRALTPKEIEELQRRQMNLERDHGSEAELRRWESAARNNMWNPWGAELELDLQDNLIKPRTSTIGGVRGSIRLSVEWVPDESADWIEIEIPQRSGKIAEKQKIEQRLGHHALHIPHIKQVHSRGGSHEVDAAGASGSGAHRRPPGGAGASSSGGSKNNLQLEDVMSDDPPSAPSQGPHAFKGKLVMGHPILEPSEGFHNAELGGAPAAAEALAGGGLFIQGDSSSGEEGLDPQSSSAYPSSGEDHNRRAVSKDEVEILEPGALGAEDDDDEEDDIATDAEEGVESRLRNIDASGTGSSVMDNFEGSHSGAALPDDSPADNEETTRKHSSTTSRLPAVSEGAEGGIELAGIGAGIEGVQYDEDAELEPLETSFDFEGVHYAASDLNAAANSRKFKLAAPGAAGRPRVPAAAAGRGLPPILGGMSAEEAALHNVTQLTRHPLAQGQPSCGRNEPVAPSRSRSPHRNIEVIDTQCSSASSKEATSASESEVATNRGAHASKSGGKNGPLAGKKARAGGSRKTKAGSRKGGNMNLEGTHLAEPRRGNVSTLKVAEAQEAQQEVPTAIMKMCPGTLRVRVISITGLVGARETIEGEDETHTPESETGAVGRVNAAVGAAAYGVGISPQRSGSGSSLEAGSKEHHPIETERLADGTNPRIISTASYSELQTDQTASSKGTRGSSKTSDAYVVVTAWNRPPEIGQEEEGDDEEDEGILEEADQEDAFSVSTRLGDVSHSKRTKTVMDSMNPVFDQQVEFYYPWLTVKEEMRRARSQTEESALTRKQLASMSRRFGKIEKILGNTLKRISASFGAGD